MQAKAEGPVLDPAQWGVARVFFVLRELTSSIIRIT